MDEKARAAAEIAEKLGELLERADASSLHMLAYLIETARQEARSVARDWGDERY